MPANFVVDTANRVIFLHLSGVVTESELFATGHAANADERAETGFARLINLSDVIEMKISSEAVRRLAEVARSFAAGRRALVATSPLTFGIARMWEQNLRLSPDASQVFDNLPDAMEFLGLDRDTPWPASPND
jgi:hypothetical protein